MLGFKKRDIPDMTVSQFKTIIDKLPKGLRTIFVHGLGESLLHKNIVELISIASHKASVTLTTNGMLLAERLVCDLFNKGLSKIILSIDSPYKEEYENIRRGASYEKILENIKLIPRIINAKFPGKGVSINMVVSEDNFDSIRGMIDLCNETGVGHLILQGVHTNTLEKRADRIAGYKEKMKAIQEYAETKKLNLSVSSLDYQNTQRRTICNMPWNILYINCDGTARPCCVHESESEKDIIVGNILAEPFGAIWNGPKMRSFRKALLSKEKPVICKSCDQLYQ
jgi:MoaA/NifB/PqqE/SkfB family radical SAM enzyme